MKHLNICYYYIGLFVLVFFSCKQEKIKVTKNDLLIDPTIKLEKNIFDLISEVEIIEIKDSVSDLSIHPIKKIIPYGKNIYIQGGKHEIYLVNEESGFLEYKLNDVGFGPNEYREIKDVSINRKMNELYIYDFEKQRFSIYDTKLKLLRIENIGYNFLNFEFLKDNFIIAFTGKHVNNINGNIIEHDLVVLDSNRVVVNKSLPFDGEKYPSVRIHNAKPFHYLEESEAFVFSDLISDSIYSVSTNNINPYGVFKYRRETLDKDFKELPHSDILNEISGNVGDFDGYDFFSSIKGINNDFVLYNFSNNGNKSYYVFKSKNTFKFKNYILPEKYREFYFKEIFEIKGSKGEHFYSALYPISLNFLKTELINSNYKGKQNILNKIDRILSNSIEDGNQVVFKFKIKDF